MGVGMQILRLENVIQNYAWGSTTAIAQLTGKPSPTIEPQAEMWMGTHPQGPSTVVFDHERLPLEELIERRSIYILGPFAAKRFDHALAFLFKVLAAARPLSIQAHPNAAQAAEGFARENRMEKSVDAPDRNYRDPNHKPEIIAALTPFWGLNGFRPSEEAAALLEPVCPQPLMAALRQLAMPENQGLRLFFEAMLRLPDEAKPAACREIQTKAESIKNQSPVYDWIIRLAQAYPTDLGILAPALLNLICLDPGQAMFLPAGQLHAYLDGVGVELMANSDNVLRGGLTPKHVDLSELLRVVRFEPTAVDILEPIALRPCEYEYECPAEEFRLSVIRVKGKVPYVSSRERSVELLLCTAGEGSIQADGQSSGEPLIQGDSLLIPASLESYTVRGDLTVYKATVPLPCTIDR